MDTNDLNRRVAEALGWRLESDRVSGRRYFVAPDGKETTWGDNTSTVEDAWESAVGIVFPDWHAAQKGQGE